MSELVVGAVQMTSTEDVEGNLERARELVRQAATAGALLVGLPSLRLPRQRLRPPAGHRRDHSRSREPRPMRPRQGRTRGRSSARCRSWPARRGPGSSWAASPNGAPATRSATAPCCSTLRGRWSPRTGRWHLFDVDFPDGTALPRAEATSPGRAGGGRDPWGGLGLSICYDIRFPELYRRLTASGARVVAVPSAFTVRPGRITGTSSSAPAPSRTRCTSWRRRSTGSTAGRRPTASAGGRSLGRGDRPTLRARGVVLARLDFDYQDRVRTALPS